MDVLLLSMIYSKSLWFTMIWTPVKTPLIPWPSCVPTLNSEPQWHFASPDISISSGPVSSPLLPWPHQDSRWSPFQSTVLMINDLMSLSRRPVCIIVIQQNFSSKKYSFQLSGLYVLELSQDWIQKVVWQEKLWYLFWFTEIS